MVKKLFVGTILLVAALVGNGCKNPLVVQLYAQSFPTTVHGTWTPNIAAENVVSYKFLINGTVVGTVAASTCTATLCTATIPVPSAGTYTFTVLASNQRLSTDPSTLQDGPTTTPPLTFALNLAPTAPKSTNIGQ